MRQLTFKGFLSQYIKKLSYLNTLDIKKLANVAATDNPRLRAPLVLYAVVTEKAALLESCLQGNDSATDMVQALRSLSLSSIGQNLESRNMPEEYLKVWNSFLVARDAPKRDDDLKGAMRKKILSIQKEKNCSNYRVYTDLHLNPGNINSWLKNGDCTKVSYRTAERVMNYVLQY